MRTVSSAFWQALQEPNVSITEIVTLTAGGQTFRWTTNNVPIRYQNQTYDPFPGVAGKGSEESTDLGIGNIEFGLANSGDINALLLSEQLGNARVLISRVFVDSPDYLAGYSVFNGKVADLSFTRDFITGTVRNAFSSVAGRWPYYGYQDRCSWRFGSEGCGVDAAAYTFASSVDASQSSALWLYSPTLSSSYAPGRLEKGRLTVLDGVNSGQIRSVRANTGDLIYLSHPLPYAVSSGGNFRYSLYPGCRKRVVEDCTSLYNNQNRFLGFPWIPKAEAAF